MIKAFLRDFSESITEEASLIRLGVSTEKKLSISAISWILVTDPSLAMFRRVFGG